MEEKISKLLKNTLNQITKEKKIQLENINPKKFIEIPPTQDMGDYAFPCFFLAKIFKSNPHQIALDIRKEIKKIPPEFNDIQVSGAYLNFFINRKKIAKELINKILNKKENFGESNIGKNKKIMIEFSQPNTHKAFHVGHIRGTSLGESLSRILEFGKSKIIRANYSGDTGMHIAKWIWYYQKYHSKEKLKDNESWIASIYVNAIKKLTENKNFQKQVQEINKKLESKEDKKLNEFWKKTRTISIKSWKKIYKELNTKFNIHYFESQVEKKGKEIATKLLDDKIAEISDNATIINLEKFNLGIWVVLRSDGTVLYSAKDLALTEQKFKDYKLDKSIVVIGNEQDFYFKQLEKVLELMKFDKQDKYKHIPFGMIRLPTGKMSSRTGDNILYSDFMNEMLTYAQERIKERTPKISEKKLKEISLKVSIAAIKYSMLKQSPNKTIVFNKKEVLNFEGDTGPYLLYSYARASSIIEKIKIKNPNFKIPGLEKNEINLIKKLSLFEDVVIKAYKELNPSLIANYSYQLAQIFNEFYHSCPVMDSHQKEFRIALVKSFRQILKNSLTLLGIKTLEKM